MTSSVAISNLALSAIGHKFFIQSLDEASVEAKQAKLHYDVAREATLRAHAWNFARGSVKLADLGVSTSQWLYTYAYPSNCIKARYIQGMTASDKIKFEVALNATGTAKVILTNQPNAELVFTHNVTNADLFDAMFIDTLSLNLGARMAPVIAPNKTQELMSKYITSLRQAQAVDASEGDLERVEETDWLEARVSAMQSSFKGVAS